MPVERFRDVAEMPPLPLASGETLTARIRAVWGRSWRLADVRWPPGVQRFRSLEEAQVARNAVVRERVRALRQRRSRPAGGPPHTR